MIVASLRKSPRSDYRELLEKTVGFGQVRAEVTAEMDFDRISTQEETYDADGQVPRSTQTIETSANSRDSEGTPPVTVGTNYLIPISRAVTRHQVRQMKRGQRKPPTSKFQKR